MGIEVGPQICNPKSEIPNGKGLGRLFMDPDPDLMREYFQTHGRSTNESKLMSVSEAVERFVHDGDYLATGGFGMVRIPTSILHEIVRTRKRDLGLAGQVKTHDAQILIAGGCMSRCDAGYMVGLEGRGLCAAERRAFESGSLEVTEWSNGALSWRLKAAAMGVPFIPTRVMMGTDTFRQSAAVEITCPFTGKKLLALPALYPDVGVIHVDRADVYGNCQIDGIQISDGDIARASKRVIITTERVVDTEEIRRHPSHTAIPHFCVDAVVEAPHGSYPGNMPGLYASDEEHLSAWLKAARDPEELEKFLDYHIYSCPDFETYLEKNGGMRRMRELERIEGGWC